MPGEFGGPTLEQMGLSDEKEKESYSQESKELKDSKYDITLESLQIEGEGPKTEYYQSVVELVSAQKTPYAEMWDPGNEKNAEAGISKRLQKSMEMLSGQIVLDLGSGGKWKSGEDEEYEEYDIQWPAFLKALENAGVEDVRYIGIDPFVIPCENPTEDPNKAKELGLEPKNDIAPSLHKEDMLTALSKMRDNCQAGERKVCMTINGIDDDIVEPEGRYHEMLLEEIRRVIPEGGLVFSRGASVGGLVDKDPSFQPVEIFKEPEFEGDYYWGVWKKV